MKKADNRKFPRLPETIRVRHQKVQFPLSSALEKNEALSANISAGGISIESSIQYKSGDVLQLDFTLPAHSLRRSGVMPGKTVDTSEVSAMAIVRYCKRNQQGGYEAGLRFSSIDAEALGVLKRFIQLKKDEV
jgi:c-di-GMP-binding flagellar brake protein YcgR